MARDDIETNEVVYSLDEGETWVTLEFKDFKFQIDEFVTEYNNEERTFLFFGKSKDQNKDTGVIGSINFSKVFSRICRGFDTPGEDESDYERWIPENFAGKKCLFGAKVSYTRKIRGVECFNPNVVSSYRKELGSCECTSEDFECDYGFKRSSDNPTKCVPLNEKFAKKLEE